MNCRDILYEALPPLEYLLEAKIRNWYERAEEVGPHRNRDNLYKSAIADVGKWIGEQSILSTFSARLTQEHQRLDIVERKAQVVLSSISVLIGLGGALLPRPSDMTESVLTGCLVFTLVLGLLLAFYATRVGIRYYIDSADLEQSAKHQSAHGLGDKALVPITALVFTALMSDVTDTKQRAADIALRSLRNSIILLALLVAWRIARNCLTGA